MDAFAAAFVALVLSLPTHNSTLRMRVWRALKEAGCGVLRDGVYLLPAGPGEAALAKLEAEIRSYGGFAMTCELRPRGAAQLAALRQLFDRGAAQAALLERIAATRGSLERLGPRRAQTAIRRLERAARKLAAIDFFPGEAKAQAEAALAGLSRGYRELYAGGEPRASRRALRARDAGRYRRRVWATRKAPWVDRLASAWLIKRFIDREARFVWIARPSECPKKAIGFDFDGAPFTHVKNRVTFEVLAASFGLDADPALAAIGAAVHFLDVGGIPVPDARGLETLLRGARERAKSDDALLTEAMRTFDLLHSAYRGAARRQTG
ncbi:MAG TPA: chromate resistance protein ChrB domain-containing protein [Burkholderiales bacterium]|nr:chromate resistance protein ChrB domain-containing protein [Burkholderiales bacterium]